MVNIDDLRRIDIFRDMPFHILDKISKEARICILEKDSLLFQTGERNEIFYMLTMGQVALRLELTKDIDVIFENLQGGNAFGLLALVKDAVSSYSAVCQEACEVITLKAPRMFELFKEDAELAFYMTKAIASQYQHLMQKRAKMTLQTLETNPDLQSGREDVGNLPRFYSKLYM